jgi:hypothetical protein
MSPGDASSLTPLTRKQLAWQLTSVCFAPGAPGIAPPELQPGDAGGSIAALDANREADGANLACCTHCHYSHSRLNTPQATTLVAQSCLVCHN